MDFWQETLQPNGKNGREIEHTERLQYEVFMELRCFRRVRMGWILMR